MAAYSFLFIISFVWFCSKLSSYCRAYYIPQGIAISLYFQVSIRLDLRKWQIIWVWLCSVSLQGYRQYVILSLGLVINKPQRWIVWLNCLKWLTSSFLKALIFIKVDTKTCFQVTKRLQKPTLSSWVKVTGEQAIKL